MKMTLKRFLAAALSVVMLGSMLAMTGCNDTKSGTAKPVILVVSFGTSYNESRIVTIGAIEKTIEERFSDYDVRRAFTSQIIIDKLKERDNIQIDNVTEALDRLVADGVKTLVVQPTHVMSGFEYDDVVAEVKKYESKFDSVAIGQPLLTSDEDYTNVATALKDATAKYNKDGNAIVFMGHGTEHESNAAYTKFQNTLKDIGADNYIVGTVESTPTLDDVVAELKAKEYKNVILEPLMVVAGDHANNDMAGDEDDSWKSVISKEGFKVTCLLRGMGEISAIRDIYVQHVQDAIDSLNK